MAAAKVTSEDTEAFLTSGVDPTDADRVEAAKVMAGIAVEKDDPCGLRDVLEALSLVEAVENRPRK